MLYMYICLIVKIIIIVIIIYYYIPQCTTIYRACWLRRMQS